MTDQEATRTAASNADAELDAAREHIEADHAALQRVWQLADSLELGADYANGVVPLAPTLAEIATKIREAVTNDDQAAVPERPQVHLQGHSG